MMGQPGMRPPQGGAGGFPQMGGAAPQMGGFGAPTNPQQKGFGF
jgi:hypothetical protein